MNKKTKKNFSSSSPSLIRHICDARTSHNPPSKPMARDPSTTDLLLSAVHATDGRPSEDEREAFRRARNLLDGLGGDVNAVRLQLKQIAQARVGGY